MVEKKPEDTHAEAPDVQAAPLGDLYGPTQSAGKRMREALSLDREPSPTMLALKANFQRLEGKLQTGLNWEEVAAKLEANPEKLVVLQRLINRGGQPTVTAKLPNGNFRFDELSPYSPPQDRNVDFDEAKSRTEKLGAKLMEPSVYGTFIGKGIVLDQGKEIVLGRIDRIDHIDSFSWLATSGDGIRMNGILVAYFGCYGKIGTFDKTSKTENVGFRCSLEV